MSELIPDKSELESECNPNMTIFSQKYLKKPKVRTLMDDRKGPPGRTTPSLLWNSEDAVSIAHTTHGPDLGGFSLYGGQS